MISFAQIRRAVRLPFNAGGRHFLWVQFFYRGQAWCTIAARWYRATLSRHKRVVMVVGTYGKTTTTRATAAALDLPVDGWLDSSANSLGEVAWSILRQPPWRRRAAIETGIAGPGRMAGYAATLRPQIVVVTCLGIEHLQSFRDTEHLRDEKAAAVRALAPTGIAVLNADDPHVRWMATQTRARVITYGFQPGCDVTATACELDWPHGMRLTVTARGQTHVIPTRLLGRHSTYAILAAFSVGLAEGIPPASLVDRLTRLSSTPGRLELIPLPSGAHALCDDYKSGVETLHAAFDFLATLPAPRKFIVLGGIDSPPNPQGPAYHEIGEHARRVADTVIVLGSSQIRRLYRSVLGQPAAPGDRLQRHEYVAHVGEAVQLLARELRPGDVVLIKGRTEQHLARVALALAGRDVRCAVDACRLTLLFCRNCPLLPRPSPLGGLRRDERVVALPHLPIVAPPPPPR